MVLMMARVSLRILLQCSFETLPSLNKCCLRSSQLGRVDARGKSGEGSTFGGVEEFFRDGHVGRWLDIFHLAVLQGVGQRLHYYSANII